MYLVLDNISRFCLWIFNFRHTLVLVFFPFFIHSICTSWTSFLQVLVAVGNPKIEFSLYDSLTSTGNAFAWKVVLGFYTWSLLSLKIPSKIYQGPAAPHSGYIPVYSANGFQYYWVTLFAFLTISFGIYPDFCREIYDNFGPIVQVLNLTALAFCTFLLLKGKLFPETGNDPLQNFDGKPWPYIFYRGVELHPRIFNADVKQVRKLNTFAMHNSRMHFIWKIHFFF